MNGLLFGILAGMSGVSVLQSTIISLVLAGGVTAIHFTDKIANE